MAAPMNNMVGPPSVTQRVSKVSLDGAAGAAGACAKRTGVVSAAVTKVETLNSRDRRVGFWIMKENFSVVSCATLEIVTLAARKNFKKFERLGMARPEPGLARLAGKL
jgi:hypothetical protein